jgi:Ankyrin repeats (many copies)
MHEVRQGNTVKATQIVAADSTLVQSPVPTHYNEPIDLLSDAIAKGDSLDAIISLIKLGAAVDPVNTLNNKKPLHKAAHYLRLDVAELLLQHGADATAASASGWYPFHNAILQLFNVHSFSVTDTEPPERDSPKYEALQVVQLLVRSYVQATVSVDIETAKCPRQPGPHFTAAMQQFAKQQLQQALQQRAVQQQQAALSNNSAAAATTGSSDDADNSFTDSMLYDSMDTEVSFSSSASSAVQFNSTLAGSSAYTGVYSSSSGGSSSSSNMLFDGVDFSAEMITVSSTTTTTITGMTAATTAAAAITTATAEAAADTADAAWLDDISNIDTGDIDIDDLDSLLDSVNDPVERTTAGVKRPRLEQSATACS